MKVSLQMIRKDDGARSPAICVQLPEFAWELKEKLSDEDLAGSCVLILGEFKEEGDSERFVWSHYPILSADQFVELNSVLPEPVLESVNNA